MQAQQHNLIIKSPNTIPTHDTRTKIFLGGSIDMGNAVDWQARVTEALSGKNVILLNPRRDDWNKNWKPLSNDPNFRQQVEWELSALEAANIIIMYFAPGSQSPVSLLELGLYARTGKLMVVCPEGYWRKGNVDIVAEKYKIKTFDSLDTLIQHIVAIVK
jgi:hypothetical protein